MIKNRHKKFLPWIISMTETEYMWKVYNFMIIKG